MSIESTNRRGGIALIPSTTSAAGAEQRTRYWFLGGSVAGIWLAVAAISIFAPDMVTGSEHDRLPVAALGTWFWGASATAFVLLAVARAGPGSTQAGSPGLAIGVLGIWLAVALASIFVPEMVTGSDPTRIPMAALIAPVAGAIGTGFLSVFVAGSGRDARRGT
jgi:hypothetical protein